ncbi:MAG: integration host factor subunit beta [Myxococcales bacterium]|nr:integration host factor subunit beta [Myxococcales bacterium]
MNRSEFTEALARQHNLTVKEAEVIIRTIFDEMTHALRGNQRIEIRGFGSFAVKEYAPYIGRNPKTGERIRVDNKRLPFFRVGKVLRDQLAEAGRLEDEARTGVQATSSKPSGDGVPVASSAGAARNVSSKGPSS